MTTSRRRWGILATVVAILFAVLGIASPARADGPTPDDAAASAKARGDDALVGGRPVEALAAYKESYKLKPDAAVLYNIGRAEQALGHYPEALERLEQFAASAPSAVLARVPGLATLLKEVRSHVATVVVSVDVDGASVKLGDREIGMAPIPPIKTSTGVVTITVEKDGYFPYSRAHTFAEGVNTVQVKLFSKRTLAIVSVTSPVVGAKLAIDGKDEGTVPTEIALSPGSHRLDLTRDGYRPTDTTIAVLAGERTSVDVPLEKSAPITKKWWFWTGIAVVAAATAAIVIVATTERGPDNGSITPGRISAGLSF